MPTKKKKTTTPADPPAVYKVCGDHNGTAVTRHIIASSISNAMASFCAREKLDLPDIYEVAYVTDIDY